MGRALPSSASRRGRAAGRPACVSVGACVAVVRRRWRRYERAPNPFKGRPEPAPVGTRVHSRRSCASRSGPSGRPTPRRVRRGPVSRSGRPSGPGPCAPDVRTLDLGPLRPGGGSKGAGPKGLRSRRGGGVVSMRGGHSRAGTGTHRVEARADRRRSPAPAEGPDGYLFQSYVGGPASLGAPALGRARFAGGSGDPTSTRLSLYGWGSERTLP